MANFVISHYLDQNRRRSIFAICCVQIVAKASRRRFCQSYPDTFTSLSIAAVIRVFDWNILIGVAAHAGGSIDIVSNIIIKNKGFQIIIGIQRHGYLV